MSLSAGTRLGAYEIVALLGAGGMGEAGADLWILPLTENRTPFPFVTTPFNEIPGAFSPDGRWISYASNEPPVEVVNGRSHAEAVFSQRGVETDGKSYSAHWVRSSRRLRSLTWRRLHSSSTGIQSSRQNGDA